MKKFVVFSVTIFFCLMSGAQDVPGDRKMVDQVTGNMLYIFQATDIKGNQFLFDKWMDGQLKLDNGQVFKNLKLKYDIYNNKIIINRHDTVFEITPVVKELILYPTVDTSNAWIFRKGAAINSTVNANAFVQLLVDGKMQLLKFTKKELEEYSDYGTATKLKRFVTVEQYFVTKAGQYKQVSLSKNSLQETVGERWPQVADYINQRKLNVKTEEGWRAAIAYYNSL